MNQKKDTFGGLAVLELCAHLPIFTRNFQQKNDLLTRYIYMLQSWKRSDIMGH